MMKIKRMLFLAANWASCVDANQTEEVMRIEQEFERLLADFVNEKVLEVLKRHNVIVERDIMD